MSRIAADEVREALPEYADGLGNELVTPECFDVTYGPVFDAVLNAGHDIVFDTIGTLNAAGQVTAGEHLRRLCDAGYLVDVLLAEAPLPVCIERARARPVRQRASDQRGAARDHTRAAGSSSSSTS